METLMDNGTQTKLAMHTLLLCSDLQFLGATRGVLNKLQVAPKIAGTSEAALELIQEHDFDVIVVDWREMDSLGDFLCAVRRSQLNAECVLVAIVRDLLDLRQAFAAGVHFLIHKPASVVQIERCLRAAYCATVTRRRKQHRESVDLAACVSTRTRSDVAAVMVNLSERGAGLRTSSTYELQGRSFSAGDEVTVCFSLPESDRKMQVTGTVVWTTAICWGIHFTFMPEGDRRALEQWLTACVERSLAQLRERLRATCA